MQNSQPTTKSDQLRNTLVVEYFTDESVSPAGFNHACEDLYIVS